MTIGHRKRQLLRAWSSQNSSSLSKRVDLAELEFQYLQFHFSVVSVKKDQAECYYVIANEHERQ